MTFTVKLTVVVIAATHGEAITKIQTAIEADSNKTSAYVLTIDRIEQKEK